MSDPSYRTRVHDYVQRNGFQTRFKYEYKPEGPPWTVEAYFDNILYGSGTAQTQAAAKETAAKQAYEAFMGDRGN